MIRHNRSNGDGLTSELADLLLMLAVAALVIGAAVVALLPTG